MAAPKNDSNIYNFSYPIKKYANTILKNWECTETS